MESGGRESDETWVYTGINFVDTDGDGYYETAAAADTDGDGYLDEIIISDAEPGSNEVVSSEHRDDDE